MTRRVRKKVELLEHHADAGALLGDYVPAHLTQAVTGPFIPYVNATDGDGAGVDRLEMVDAAQQCRLSRSTRAEETDDLTGADFKADSLENLQVTKSLVYIADHDHRVLPELEGGAHVRLPKRAANPPANIRASPDWPAETAPRPKCRSRRRWGMDKSDVRSRYHRPATTRSGMTR